MSKVNYLRLVLLVTGLMSAASAITSTSIVRKHREVEQRLMETLEKQNSVLQKQNDTIKFQSDVIASQSKVIARLKAALEERSQSRGPVVLNGRLNSE